MKAESWPRLFGQLSADFKWIETGKKLGVRQRAETRSRWPTPTFALSAGECVRRDLFDIECSRFSTRILAAVRQKILLSHCPDLHAADNSNARVADFYASKDRSDLRPAIVLDRAEGLAIQQ